MTREFRRKAHAFLHGLYPTEVMNLQALLIDHMRTALPFYTHGTIVTPRQADAITGSFLQTHNNDIEGRPAPVDANRRLWAISGLLYKRRSVICLS